MLCFMQHMNKEDLEACICPVLEKLASEDMEEEYRTEAVEVHIIPFLAVVRHCVRAHSRFSDFLPS